MKEVTITLHLPDGADIENISVEGETIESAEGGGKSGYSHRNRDRALRGMVLDSVDKLDSPTAKEIAEFLDEDFKSVETSLSNIHDFHWVDRDNDEKPYQYTFRPIGEQALRAYRQAWEDGYYGLPPGGLEDLVPGDAEGVDV